MIVRVNRFRIMLNALIVLISVVCTFVAIILSRSGEEPAIRELEKEEIKKETKFIYMDFPGFYELSMGGEHFKSCPDSNCALTNVEYRLPDSDAVIFYTHYQKDGPPVKTPNQIWIYFAVESPVYCNNELISGPAWRNSFNWTMTYRYDSDLWFGYGKVVAKSKNVASSVDREPNLEGKKKMVAWIVSNCEAKSKRKEYVNLLQQKIPVDVFGKCGFLECPKHNSDDCMKNIAKEYKFYLSFENSLCRDYLTEKVFRTLKYDIVPIVRGGAKYKEVLPHMSVIDTEDFKTTDELAKYLQFLDRNPDEYKKFFAWKKEYDIIEPVSFPFCDLCNRVNNPGKFEKVYENVNDWYHKDACREASDIL